MKLYKITADDDTGKTWTEFTSSDGEASKACTRLKKEGLKNVGREGIDINTDRTSLIRFLNGLMAHDSCKLKDVTEALGGYGGGVGWGLGRSRPRVCARCR